MLAAIVRKARQLRVSIVQRGVCATLYWGAFGYLRPNRFIILERDLCVDSVVQLQRLDVRLELWDSAEMRTWRAGRHGLPPEFFQDDIDGVRCCAVAVSEGEPAGLIWIYRPGDPSRLFRLHEAEAELNNGCVLRQHRGRGLFREVLGFACYWLSEHGYRKAYAGVHAGNAPSMTAFRGAGFREIGSVCHWLVYRPAFHRGDGVSSPGVDPKR